MLLCTYIFIGNHETDRLCGNYIIRGENDRSTSYAIIIILMGPLLDRRVKIKILHEPLGTVYKAWSPCDQSSRGARPQRRGLLYYYTRRMRSLHFCSLFYYYWNVPRVRDCTEYFSTNDIEFPTCIIIIYRYSLLTHATI